MPEDNLNEEHLRVFQQYLDGYKRLDRIGLTKSSTELLHTDNTKDRHTLIVLNVPELAIDSLIGEGYVQKHSGRDWWHTYYQLTPQGDAKLKELYESKVVQ